MNCDIEYDNVYKGTFVQNVLDGHIRFWEL